MEENWKKSVTTLYDSLEFNRRAVGVRFIKSEKEFDNIDAINPKKPINYCGIVKGASCGHKIKANEDSIACSSGSRVLGINPSDVKNSQGENWKRLGLYKDGEISKSVRDGLNYIKEDIYGVLVQPLEFFMQKPEIVIIVTNPYNIMRLVHGYAYHYGMPKNINLVGNQAICLECTARPYVIEDLNLSVLCIGTRHRAGWSNDEMALGMPFCQFENVVDGVFNTINIMEDNSNKRRIEKNIKSSRIKELKIDYNYNYYRNV